MEAYELKLKDVMCGDWVDVRNNAATNTPHDEVMRLCEKLAWVKGGSFGDYYEQYVKTGKIRL